MHLNTGEAWKYGETTSAERYTESYKANIGWGGVTEVPQFLGKLGYEYFSGNDLFEKPIGN
nr:hypothetical protein [uncultured Pedobacter sp.]